MIVTLALRTTLNIQSSLGFVLSVRTDGRSLLCGGRCGETLYSQQSGSGQTRAMKDGGDQLREHVLGHTAAVLAGVSSYHLVVLGAELAIHHALACCRSKLTQVHTQVYLWREEESRSSRRDDARVTSIDPWTHSPMRIRCAGECVRVH